MKKVLNPNFQAGSTRFSNGPRPVCDIITELFASNSLFVKAFRQSADSHEDAAAEGQADDARSRTTVSVVKGWFRNTELCVDVKTFLRHDRIAKIGKNYTGVLCRDTDDHYSFVETATPVANAIIRNPHVFEGKYINVTRRMRDGHIRFNFKDVDFGGRFNPLSFAIAVMKEILKAFKCLGEEVYKTPKQVG
ncbi:hypothetical protein [Prevotella sp.]|uniref:hypothetical protein n=1 Tax=Prevotella sp. TaxID=59823 RepID=UPI0025E573EC|nr:hypothetical protein [Prevotella sp.]MCI6129769.1 hypothetical protein [Prevotella sp.]